MTTNVPAPALTDTGYVPPTEAAIIAGLQLDFNQAFSVDLNFGTVTNPTPQGQLVATLAAVIGNAQANFCTLANVFDPAYSYGRYQDALGRIYFLTRNPGQSTTVPCLCTGLQGTVILPGSYAQDTSGTIYTAVTGAIIPAGGSVTTSFECQTPGPVPCPAGTLTTIYRAIPGWDTISNPTDGVLGTVTETRAAFEIRRQETVAANSISALGSVLGAVEKVAGVLDAYVTDNSNSYPLSIGPTCVIVGSMSGTTLTVASVTSGAIVVGMTITGSNGTGIGVAAGTTIVSGAGSSWVISVSQTVASTTMNLGGVILAANNLYVAAVGGSTTNVATAIWDKKAPGCPYYAGNTTVTVYDTAAIYPPPGVPYVVTYMVPPALPFVFKVTLVNNAGIPSNATALIQAAIILAFAGGDGLARARIGSTVLASRFYAPVAALGSWAQIASILIGTENTKAASVTATIGASFTATGAGTNLTVTSIAGYLSAGDIISGTGIPTGTTIVSQSSGTTGSNGVYVTSVATTASAAACTTTSTVLRVSAVASGTVALDQYIFDVGDVTEGTYITALITGAGGTGTYRLNNRMRIPSETMSLVAADQTVVHALINQAPTTSAPIIEVVLV